jgi:hypothetical protein
LASVPPAAAQGVVENGCPNEANVPHPDCSKLAAGERITVMATECGYGTTCPTTAPLICRAIINDGGLDYFVPWKTPGSQGYSGQIICAVASSETIADALGLLRSIFRRKRHADPTARSRVEPGVEPGQSRRRRL